MGKLSKKRKILLSVQCICCVVILLLTIIVNCVCVYWSEPLTQALGVTGAKQGDAKSYYEPDFASQAEALADRKSVV